MKRSLSSLLLTTLLLTSLFQPHQNISAASQNNSDEVAIIGCIGPHCLNYFVDDQADLIMDQLAKSNGNPNIRKSLAEDKLPFSCGPNKHYGGSSCVDNPSPQYLNAKVTGRCDPKYRDPSYHPAGCP
ncbi:hypothetical protein KIW84_036202 [Lathyrus oleraceus]|uniref:Uncharacterized protein n=1 Tax=Pisum sativum TaxID=3888 RepID=A0A9D5B7T7_PEA|nr:hypothetical protein KIW84_036202 [Pisum sativum]